MQHCRISYQNSCSQWTQWDNHISLCWYWKFHHLDTPVLHTNNIHVNTPIIMSLTRYCAQCNRTEHTSNYCCNIETYRLGSWTYDRKVQFQTTFHLPGRYVSCFQPVHIHCYSYNWPLGPKLFPGKYPLCHCLDWWVHRSQQLKREKRFELLHAKKNFTLVQLSLGI